MNDIESLPLIQELPPTAQEVILRVAALILALLLIWVLRRLVAWLILSPLRRLANRTPYKIDNQIIQSIESPMRYAIMALGISLAISFLDFGEGVTAFGNQIARTLFIVALFVGIFRVFRMASVTPEVLHRFTGIHIQERLLPFIWTLIRVMIVLLGIVIILQEWGFEISGLIASLGIVGLAFSLAAKDTVENLFGFTAIVGDNPFEVGNFIKTPDVSGTIEQVGVRSTRVRQLDQALVTVPNSKLAGAVVLNWSRLEKRRLGFSLGLTYDTTSDEIRVVTYRIREMLKSRSTIDPESVVVNFTDFGSSSLDILIVSQILLADWKEFTAEKQDILLAIMDIVSDMGLSIAYPSQTLYIDAPGITPAKPQRPAVELPPELLGITEDPDMLLENIEDAEIRELTDGQESDEAGDEQTGEVKR